MSDQIRIDGIHAFGYHGVFNQEAVDGQDFFVDLAISLDLSRASVTDDLSDTLDYGALADLVIEEVTGERAQLIEKLAGRIADRITELHPEILALSVTVHKPQAPVNAKVKDISVTINR